MILKHAFKLSRIHLPPCPMGPNTFRTVLPVISPGCLNDVGSWTKTKKRQKVINFKLTWQRNTQKTNRKTAQNIKEADEKLLQPLAISVDSGTWEQRLGHCCWGSSHKSPLYHQQGNNATPFHGHHQTC